MLLRNLIQIFTSGLSKTGSSITLRGGGKLNPYYLNTSTSLYYSEKALGARYNSTSTSSFHLDGVCIAVGTGTTPANYLDDDLKTGPIAIETGTVQISDGKIIISATYTPTEDKTITEIGVAAGRYDSYAYGIMLTRTVFDTPVTIKANTTKTFSITIDCNKFSEGYTIN